MEEYILKKPITFDGSEVKALNLDLDGLTVDKLEKAEQQARVLLGKKESIVIPALNQKYCACVAAIAAGVKVALVRSLAANDYTQLCMLVQNFLLGGDSDSENPTEKAPEKSETPSMTD
jgi:hypothetical protein